MAAFVEYVGDDCVVPSRTFAGGHFRAHFREDTCWYCADDSVVKIVAAESQLPIVYPYICFFERSDLGATPPWFPRPCFEGASSECESPEQISDDDQPISKKAEIGVSSSGFCTATNAVKRRRLTTKQAAPACYAPSKIEREGQGSRLKRDRTGWKQIRTGQKQDRTSRK